MGTTAGDRTARANGVICPVRDKIEAMRRARVVG